MVKAGAQKKITKDPTLDICSVVVNACNEAKAKDLVVLKTSELSDICSYQVIATANSDRQVQGIAHKISEALEVHGYEEPDMEGMETAHWVVIDCGDVMAHVFYGPTREHYDLESLWTKAPRLKLVENKSGITLR